MLKQRIITAVILGSLVVFAIFTAPHSVIGILFAFIALLGAWEWAALMGAETKIKRLSYVLVIGVLILLVWFFESFALVKIILLLASIWWAAVALLLSFYREDWLQSKKLQTLLACSGVIVLVPAWLALVTLHNASPAILMFFLALVWLADIAAYFVGKRFGQHKLAPKLSPGKSREGVAGALLASIGLAFIGLIVLPSSGQHWFYFVLLCALTALISVFGDLYESLLKRKAGVKDSGTILPGHGGILDRIDSITAAGPGFALGIHWLCMGCLYSVN